MLAYSSKTANALKTFHYKVMSTAQRETLQRAFKRYAIAQFKKASKDYTYDGTSSGFFSKRVYKVTTFDFLYSEEFKAVGFVKKGEVNQNFSFSHDDKLALCKKVKSLIVAAGYKAELKGTDILMWKPKKIK